MVRVTYALEVTKLDSIKDIQSSYIAQNGHSKRVSGRDDEEVDIDIQNDGPAPYQVVQVGAAQADQSGKGNIHLLIVSPS